MITVVDSRTGMVMKVIVGDEEPVTLAPNASVDSDYGMMEYDYD